MLPISMTDNSKPVIIKLIHTYAPLRVATQRSYKPNVIRVTRITASEINQYDRQQQTGYH